MRVIGGDARGRRLQAPPTSRTRPTTDRVRESVFTALGSRIDLEGATVLDLFAGSGAMGIEALSRGAARAVFVDRDRRAVETIRANLGATGLGTRAEVVCSDVSAHLRSVPKIAPDVVFCDPPYAFDEWDALLGCLSAPLVVVESDRPVTPLHWDVVRERRYGTTFVMFVVPSADASPSRPPFTPPEQP